MSSFTKTWFKAARFKAALTAGKVVCLIELQASVGLIKAPTNRRPSLTRSDFFMGPCACVSRLSCRPFTGQSCLLP